MTNEMMKELVEENLSKTFGVQLTEATVEQLYKATAQTINDILRRKRKNYNSIVKANKGKRVYYLSMEFLMGRSLKNNLYNLSLVEPVQNLVEQLGYHLDDLFDYEPDAGLGNGGLGRLAACYFDALASAGYPAMGYSLRYEYGLFKQKIVNNWQTELPDVWLPGGEVWLTLRGDKNYPVRFYGKVEEKTVQGKPTVEQTDTWDIEAVPYDMMVSGANSEAISVLRLWRSRNIHKFDLHSFSQGDYYKAMKDYTEADLITKILYPTDDHPGGKELRLKQQYFLVSASMQNIVSDHLRYYGDIRSFPKYVAIHINDTHPALCIPELMRIFMDEHHLSFDEGWEMVTKSVSYTNHTVLSEALEKWQEELIAHMLPRIHQILHQINDRFLKEARCQGMANGNLDALSIFHHGQVRMANLCIIGSHCVNGVSALHSQIIRKSIFAPFYQLTPKKFTNVTNGIAYRRWLYQSNPNLSGLLEKTIGHDYYKNAFALEQLAAYANDEKFLTQLQEIKFQNKVAFARYLFSKEQKVIDPNTRFDVQIKRIHEYKRQLLNVLKIIALLIQLEEDINTPITPQTYIFGGKAAPGYYQAKEVIELINALAAHIAKYPAVQEKLNVVFIEDYNVSVAEKLIPASEVSEQISLAGKEASGTGNMKFMLNGAVTFGTLDGANVEIHEQVTDENMILFGLKAQEVEECWKKGYHPQELVESSELLSKVMKRLLQGFNQKSFSNIVGYLTQGYPVSDPFMCIADFHSYYEAYLKMDQLYQDQMRWQKMSLVNISKAGVFSADRSIEEYAKKIWKLKKY
ncbi:MAG: glycogen/starch/alpha-glucan phosphorylase [Bacilli bacterium]|jgi:starch phosphorylase|nr:glycogen/starch/alpha-glucan phosphorylase [Bacilli bacterium]